MLDPASAIGLAASIVQLVDFTKNVLSKSHELYQSADGSLVKHSDILNVSSTFQRLIWDLKSKAGPVRSLNPAHANQAEEELHDLYKGTTSAIAPLVKAVEKLKFEPKQRAWRNLLVAFKCVMKEDAIEELENRLDRYRKQIDTTLLFSLRQWVEHIQDSQKANFTEIQDSLSILKNASKAHADVLEELRQDPSLRAEFVHNELPSEFSAQFLSAVVQRDQGEMERLREQRLLESIKFPEMPNRHESIPSAYQETFEWIFSSSTTNGQEVGKEKIHQTGYQTGSSTHQNDWSDFTEWLQNDQHLYWITGKPGAGKSTLMKYLYHDSRTRNNMTAWASRASNRSTHVAKDEELPRIDLSIAAFFCWNSGTSIQMSKLGLLRTLLYDLLTDLQELNLKLFPERLLRFRLFGGDSRPFEWQELLAALNVLLSQTDRYFLLFLDGLDEFDGNTSEMAELALEISRRPNVKVCASSRPWMVFEDAFDGRPMLRIEDLTRDDILTYITGKFATSKRFVQLKDFRPVDAERLIIEIADKAYGVFLWVYVVVESLLEGLRDGDDMETLSRRLEDLPEELEDLFDRILRRLNPAYSKEASEMFQFVRLHPGEASLRALFLSNRTLEQALGTECAILPEDEIIFFEESMRRRVYSRCKCLLEVESKRKLAANRWAMVNYLHRTVREYLEQPRVWDQIRRNSGTYDSYAALGISLLLQAKQLVDVKSGRPHNVPECARAKLVKSIQNLADAPSPTVSEKISFVDEVERTGTLLLMKQMPTHIQNVDGRLGWMQKLDQQEAWGINNANTFIAPRSAFEYALSKNMGWYVAYRLEQDSTGSLANTMIDGHYPLILTVQHKYWSSITSFLQHGANPNLQQEGQSAWTLILNATEIRFRSADHDERNCYIQALTKFLKCGADLSACSLEGAATDVVQRAIRIVEGDSRLADGTEALRAALDNAQRSAASSPRPDPLQVTQQLNELQVDDSIRRRHPDRQNSAEVAALRLSADFSHGKSKSPSGARKRIARLFGHS